MGIRKINFYLNYSFWNISGTKLFKNPFENEYFQDNYLREVEKWQT